MMALPPIPTQASQLQKPPQQQQQHHQASSGLNLHNLAGSNGSASVSIPRRRVSYLIPPPPASQPPPLLTLPSGSPAEIRARKRGNPNPLIMLADPDALSTADTSDNGLNQQMNADSRSSTNDSRFAGIPTRAGSSNAGGREGVGEATTASNGLLSSSFAASSSSAATSTSSRHYHSNNTTIQRHPEHTLGITALALDTSTIIDNSSSPSRKKTPGGILYSGGRDGLVASWELSLPFKKRDSEEAFVGNGHRKGRRKAYLPRWAEDSYADDDLQDLDDEDDDDDEEENSSSDEETAGGRRKMGNTSLSRRDVEEDNEAEELLLGSDEGAYPTASPPLPGSSPRLRLDTGFGHSGITSGLQLDLSSQQEQRRRQSTSSSYKRFTLNGSQKPAGQSSLPYENRWRLDNEQLEARVRPPQYSRCSN